MKDPPWFPPAWYWCTNQQFPMHSWDLQLSAGWLGHPLWCWLCGSFGASNFLCLLGTGVLADYFLTGGILKMNQFSLTVIINLHATQVMTELIFLSFYFSVLILLLAVENEMVEDSIINTATRYGLDCMGNESRWGWDFPPVQTSLGDHPASYTVGTRPFHRIKRL